MFLGLPSDKLAKIKVSCSQELDKALIETLMLWLRQQYDTKQHGSPTWHTLVKAISMMDTLLASQIAAEHPKGMISCACS